MRPIAPQPASKYEEVFNALNRFKDTGNFTPFDLHRLRREAKKIKENVNIADGFELLGMLACFEGDAKVMHSCHKRALQQSGREARYIANYAKSLVAAGLYEDAYKYATEAYDKNPLLPASLDAIITTACVLDKKDEFARCIKVWTDVNKTDHYLTLSPLYLENDSKLFYEFIHKYPDTIKIRNLSNPGLIRFFGYPLNVFLEIMPGSNHKDNLVAWIQWCGEMDDGMERYDRFEDWHIDNDYDMKSDILNFNIEFMR
ncbi:hypothetical protein QUF72_05220 [Desulfobacterales bacterium HSG2]|nr:hypothetical protein [Desulfobacterales bacterium HSG2]